MDFDTQLAIANGIVFALFVSGLLAAAITPVWMLVRGANECRETLTLDDVVSIVLVFAVTVIGTWFWAVPHYNIVWSHPGDIEAHLEYVHYMGSIQNDVPSFARWAYWGGALLYLLVSGMTIFSIALMITAWFIKAIFDLVRSILQIGLCLFTTTKVLSKKIISMTSS